MASKDNRKPRVIELQESPLGFQADDYIKIGDGLYAERSHPITIFERELGVKVDLELDFEEGRYVISRCVIERLPGAPPITSATQRALRLADYRVQGTKARFWRGIQKGDRMELKPIDPGERFEDESEEQFVARIYRMCLVMDYKPTKGVQEALGCAASTAAQKVVLARKLGLLPRTTPGKAKGEELQ